MPYENLLYEKDRGLAYVTVNRPEKLNALNRKTIEELAACFEEIRGDREVQAAIVTGKGEKAFIAGADIEELAGQTPRAGQQLSRRGQQVLSAMENLGKPVIAAINGFALGGGLEVALACTLRLASENARLGQPEVKLGIIPGYGGTQRLARLVGKGPALEVLLSGESLTAQEAYRIGLVNRVVPAAELMPAAEGLGRKIIANAPLAVRFMLEAVHRGLEMPLQEALYLEATLFALCCTTEDMKEGMQAFLERRPACFRGR